MASVNKVILVGNLGRDPETRTFPNGDMVANVTVATTDKWRDKSTGESRTATEWHRVSFHGRLAEIAAQYLRKGSQVYIEGSLRTRKWMDQQTGQERFAVDIRADVMQMLGGRQDGGGGGYGGAARGAMPVGVGLDHRERPGTADLAGEAVGVGAQLALAGGELVQFF